MSPIEAMAIREAVSRLRSAAELLEKDFPIFSAGCTRNATELDNLLSPKEPPNA